MKVTSFTITLNPGNQIFQCDSTEHLLVAMGKAFIKDVQTGCCQGGCGVCKIVVEQGEFTTKVMSREKVSEEEQSRGIVLACRVYPRTNLTISCLPKNNQIMESTNEYESKTNVL